MTSESAACRSVSVLPNLILGGAQKSGTTTLHRVLQSHPSIFIPRPPVDQEIHYFDLDHNYSRGLAWYESHFTGWRGEPVVGQTSPLYLYSVTTPMRMHALLPKAKIVFILRDPVSRAYSHYWHEVRFGWETLTFEEAIDREPERILGGESDRRRYSYVDRGFYAMQLERWLEFFPRDQILLLLNETLAAEPDVVLRTLAGFVEADVNGFDMSLAEQRHNRAKLPSIPLLQRLVRNVRLRFPAAGLAVDLVNLRNRRYPPMQPATRLRLQQMFAADVSKLEKDWGIDTRIWASGRGPSAP